MSLWVEGWDDSPEFKVFEVDEQRYLFHVRSTACLAADDLACELLVRATGRDELVASGRWPAEEIDSAIAEINELGDQGAFEPAADVPSRDTFSTLELHISHVCNMRCRYCFAEAGDYGGEAKLMSEALALDAIDTFIDQLPPEGTGTIVYFGGEPLMNRPVILAGTPHALRRAKEQGKTVRFSITTNATMLDDEIIAFMNEHEFTVLISIDGPPDVQDHLRPLKSGAGSYEKALSGIQRLSSSRGGRLTARATLCHGNVRLTEIADHFGDIGFDQVAASPVSCSGCDVSLALDEHDCEDLLREYERCAERTLSAARGENAERGPAVSLFRDSLSTLAHGMPKRRACGTGYGIMTVTPDGAIYPCHRFVGSDAWRMGHVDSGVDEASRARFLGYDVDAIDGCRDCWVRYMCAGGCLNDHALDDGTFGDAEASACELSRQLMETTLALYVRLEALREGGAAEAVEEVSAD